MGQNSCCEARENKDEKKNGQEEKKGNWLSCLNSDKKETQNKEKKKGHRLSLINFNIKEQDQKILTNFKQIYEVQAISEISQDFITQESLSKSNEYQSITDLPSIYPSYNKIFKKENPQQQYLSQTFNIADEYAFWQQKELLSTYNHPNLVEIFELFQDNTTYKIVYNYHGYVPFSIYKNTSLQFKFKENQIKSFAEQLLGLIFYLHSNGLIIKSIGPDHILVNQEDPFSNPFKLANLSLAVKPQKAPIAQNVDLRYYGSPEFYSEQNEFTQASDL